MLVLAFHASLASFAGGYIGVDVFFVLSGFLITGLLIRDAENGSLSLVDFYARRARRLLPAALVVILVTSLVWVAIASVIEREPLIADARSAALYFSNWHFAAQSTDYFASANAASPFIHFWSLSVEEQFYLAWPAIVLLAYRFRGRANVSGRRNVAVIAAVLSGASLISLAVTTWSGSSSFAYFGTPSRAYQLLIGALLATVVRGRALRRTEGVQFHPQSVYVVQILAFAGLIVIATDAVGWGPGVRGLIASGLALVVLASFEFAPASPFNRILSLAPVVYLGQISYGIYLWHWPIILVLRRFVVMSPLATFLVASVISIILAAVSNSVLERPIRYSPSLAKRARLVLTAALVASLVGGLVLVPDALGAQTKPRILPVTAATSPLPALQTATTPTPSLAAIKVARAGLTIPQPTCLATLGAHACLTARGTGATVLVIGDSHLEAFLPVLRELALKHHATLWTWMLYVCPWEKTVLPAGANDSACRNNKQDLQSKVLATLHPDVVITLNRGYDDPAFPRALYLDGSAEKTGDPGAILSKAMAGDMTTMLKYTGHLVVIEPWPSLQIDQNICLSKSQFDEQCTAKAAAGKLPEEVAGEKLAGSQASAGRVSMVDIDKLACPRLPICDAVVGGTVVRRDQDHLSIPFAAKIADSLDQRLTDAHAWSAS
jgi:peptidoglycan/LPS O-acetylase OafA/YrhL